MTKTAEKKLSKRSRILDAAFELFVNNSFHSTAIDDVVRLAGVAKGTFYLYFKDKYDLLEQLTAGKSAVVLENAIISLQNRESAELPIGKKCVFIADHIIEYLSTHREIAALINKNFSSCFSLMLKEDSESFSHALDSLFLHFAENGFCREEAKKILFIITDMVGSVCCSAILGCCPFTVEELKPVIFKAIENALHSYNEPQKEFCR